MTSNYFSPLMGIVAWFVFDFLLELVSGAVSVFQNILFSLVHYFYGIDLQLCVHCLPWIFSFPLNLKFVTLPIRIHKSLERGHDSSLYHFFI